MMGVIVIVIVCAAFGLTVSEAKTEIDHNVFTHKGSAVGSAIFSVEAAGQVYNQTSELSGLATFFSLFTRVPPVSRTASTTTLRFLALFHLPSALPNPILVPVIVVPVPISATILASVPVPVPVPIRCSSTGTHPRPRPRPRPVPAPVPVPVPAPSPSP